MAEDSAKSLTPPVIDIIDSKIRSLRERESRMERRLKRYPIVGLVSEWEVVRWSTRLAAACVIATAAAAFGLFLRPSSEATTTNQPTQIQQVTEQPIPTEDKIEWYKNQYLAQKETGFKELASKIQREYKPLIKKSVSTIQERTRFKDVNQHLIDAIPGLIVAESSGRPDMISEDRDRGLCQVRPDAEAEARAELKWGNVDIHDPGVNITLALTYLAIQMDRFNDPVLAISAYNVGPGTVLDFIKQKEDLSPYENPGIDYYRKVAGAKEAVSYALTTQTKA